MIALRPYLIPCISLGMLTFGIHHVLNAEKTYPHVPPPDVPARSPFEHSIAATGMIEPQSDNIAVGSALSGVVAEVYVPADQSGMPVKAGEPLFRIDDRHWQAQLAVCKAQLEVPQAELAKLECMPRREEVTPVEYRVAAARANLLQANDAYNRSQRLVSTGASTEAEVVQNRQGQAVAEAELAKAIAELELIQAGAWNPDKQIIRARVRQIESQIAEIQTEIERSLVRAPVDGVILQVNVRPGEFVGAPASKDLVVIGDMRQPRVRVEIDERDIPDFKPDAPARAVLRGNGSHQVQLKFIRIEPYVVPKKVLSGLATERVDTRVLQVLYGIEPTEAPIYVGQQVDVYVSREKL